MPLWYTLTSESLKYQRVGPTQPATTARYAHLADDPVKAASDAVGRHIAAAMDGMVGEAVDFGRSRGAQRRPR